MKIFLSSTAYDLSDFRALVVERLEKNGHEVLFHESPTFPTRIGLHSHDQCLEAIKESDLVICLIDRRYGGKYQGTILSPFEPIEFSVNGKTKSGKKKEIRVKYELRDLSITWCEVYTAHKEGIPVITFARQRTLDEKETRRRNQYLSSFTPAYVEKNEIFDLLDWITKRETNNWIAPFISIVDFEKKLLAWMTELNKSIPTKTSHHDDSASKSRVCIVVEGEVDRLFISFVIEKLKLTHHFVIIPTYGKYQVLNKFKEVVLKYTKLFENVIVLLDSDASTSEEYQISLTQLQNLIIRSKAKNLVGFFAHPSIESWIIAGLDSKLYNNYKGEVDKSLFIKYYGKLSINDIRNLLYHKFSINKAMSINREFNTFIEHLIGLGKVKIND